MSKAFPTFHTDVGEALAVNSQQVPIEQSLLCSFIVAELAFMHLGGWWRRSGLVLGLSVVMLQPVGEQCRLLVELLATHFALKGGLAAKSMDLHVVVEAGFLVGGEVAVCTLVLLPCENILVMILGVAFQEAS